MRVEVYVLYVYLLRVMFYVFRVITIIISVKGGFPLIELPTRLFLSLV